MSGVDPALPDGPFEPLPEDGFCFACHPDVPCFNACCADLNLILTPYDILRLKNNLELRSDEFLERYAVDADEQSGRFPKVMLKMTDRSGRPCPFVTPKGCSVYPDRPGACRTYPVGRGSAPGGREMFFLVKEDHCRGFETGPRWTPQTWLTDQGLGVYNQANDRWMEILTAKASLGPEEHRIKKLQMFYMVSYNLDRFRDFLFGTGFWQKFDLPDDRIEAVKTDDAALLELGFDWLWFSLYGQRTLSMKS
jgi:hypothetical protein